MKVTITERRPRHPIHLRRDAARSLCGIWFRHWTCRVDDATCAECVRVHDERRAKAEREGRS